MAEKGAHLTPVTHNKPSIFDCIAQEALNDLLHPLFEKVINVLSLRNEFFSIISKWCNEMYFLGYFGVQFYFLKKYGK